MRTMNSPNSVPHAPTPGVGRIDGLRSALNRALRGKPAVIEQVLTCLLARGHLLLEDLPGLGKTTLAKALAQAIGGRFARVQCTPDLLPGDITGFSVFNQKTREFEFLPGPVFSEVLLADEINRTTPRTQSALLEAMAERQVTVDNVRHGLTATFFVIATQNPVEHHGTYPLPEAQLDRFAMKLSIGYPERAEEVDLLTSAVGDLAGMPSIDAVLQDGQLLALQEQVAGIAVSPEVQRLPGGPGTGDAQPSAGDAGFEPARPADLAAGGAGLGLPAAAAVCDARRRAAGGLAGAGRAAGTGRGRGRRRAEADPRRSTSSVLAATRSGAAAQRSAGCLRSVEICRAPLRGCAAPRRG